MGSWFSSSSRPPPAALTPQEKADAVFDLVVRHLLKKNLTPSHDEILSPRTRQRFDDTAICDLANDALKQYNSNHPGAPKFDCPSYLIGQSESELKVACVGFREDLWYHLNFLACRRRDGDDAVETRRFFAELRFEPCPERMIVQTCTILEEPWCRFSTSCAFCPDESKILHPPEFECGKQGHQEEFFRHRCGTDGRTKAFFSQSEMLHTPFMLGAPVPRYSLDYVDE